MREMGTFWGISGSCFGSIYSYRSKWSESSKVNASLPRRREDDEEEEEGISDGGGEKEKKRKPESAEECRARDFARTNTEGEHLVERGSGGNIEMNVGELGDDNFEKESPSTDERFNRKLCFGVAADGSHSKVQKIRQELYGKEVVPDLKYLGVVLITGFVFKTCLLNK